MLIKVIAEVFELNKNFEFIQEETKEEVMNIKPGLNQV